MIAIAIIFTTVTLQKQLLIYIRSNSKHPDEKAITDYIIKIFATNIDESFVESIIKKLVDQNVLENKPSVVRGALSLLLQRKRT